MEYVINRKGEQQELAFPFSAGAKSGICDHCKAKINAYDSYYIDRNTGDMYCPECGDWARQRFLIEHGFFYYTDG